MHGRGVVDLQDRLPAAFVRALLVCLALLFSGCLAALPDNDDLPVEKACLISAGQAVPITVEVARTPAERSR